MRLVGGAIHRLVPLEKSAQLSDHRRLEGKVMNRDRFEELVAKAVDDLPDEFRSGLENVDVVVQDYPNRRQLARVGRGMTLLGLYEGVPQARRTHGYGMVLPDRILIFQKPIQEMCRSEAEVEAEIGRVVRHEIAHHFGLDEDELRRIEAKDRRRKKH
jgi:predicted Zn-dependent protease with MMP-like domain